MTREHRLAAVTAIAFVTPFVSSFEAHALTVFDPSNFQQNVQQVAQALAQTAVQQVIQYGVGKLAQATGLPGPLLNMAAQAGMDKMFLQTGLNGVFGGVPSQFPSGGMTFGSMPGALWQVGTQLGTQVAKYAIGEGLEQIGIDPKDPLVAAGLSAGYDMMQRSVGQSATWAKVSTPSFAYYGARAPTNVFTTAPSAIGFMRTQLQRPSVQSTPVALTQIQVRRSRELEEAALDAIGLAAHGLAAASGASQRVESMQKAALSATELRQQMAVLNGSMTALYEELAGIRVLVAAGLRVRAAEVLANRPVTGAQAGANAVPQTTTTIQGLPWLNQGTP
ncbi:MAG: hypothetical protein KAY22_02305 [Rhizorhabdus sp.]|uniref:hypothetical protein n=1 Tax=Rhizorhabdus sp. TaxID=1968843 RepID=UPI001B67F6DC|nr:hypothetical protein [Rhizorhabdus sp.]MBP8231113.1 hypothetical protein [Rhizorhabdus sp.]